MVANMMVNTGGDGEKKNDDEIFEINVWWKINIKYENEYLKLGIISHTNELIWAPQAHIL